MRLLPIAVACAAAGFSACTPDWAKSSNSEVMLLMTGINNGNVLQSDVEISSGSVCSDFVPLRLENHFKNPTVTNTGFRDDFVVRRYDVHYRRSDGHNVEGVDVPYSISGNLATEVREESDATLNLEVVRAAAKLEPPLRNLRGGGGLGTLVVFADVTLHAQTTTGDITNDVSATVQVDFADYGDTLTTCPTTGP